MKLGSARCSARPLKHARLAAFHSIGGPHPALPRRTVQLKSNFTVLDVDTRCAVEAAAAGQNITDKPGRRDAGRPDRRWKNRGLTPSQCRGEPPCSQRQGGKLYASYQTAENPQRRRFRDLLLENIRLFRRIRTSPANTRPLKFILSTNIRTPTSRSICGCALSQAPSSSKAQRRLPLPRPAGRGRCTNASVRSFHESSCRRSPSPRPLSAKGREREQIAPSSPQAPLKNICCVAMTTSRSMAGACAEFDNIRALDHYFPGHSIA